MLKSKFYVIFTWRIDESIHFLRWFGSVCPACCHRSCCCWTLNTEIFNFMATQISHSLHSCRLGNILVKASGAGSPPRNDYCLNPSGIGSKRGTLHAWPTLRGSSHGGICDWGCWQDAKLAKWTVVDFKFATSSLNEVVAFVSISCMGLTRLSMVCIVFGLLRREAGIVALGWEEFVDANIDPEPAMADCLPWIEFIVAAAMIHPLYTHWMFRNSYMSSN